MRPGWLYFNTRTKTFEVTDYLRKVNKAKPEIVACAEPLEQLPGDADLKSKCEVMDKELNVRYAAIIAKINKDDVVNCRDSQRAWLKQRDEGLKVYVACFPPAEKGRRRWQFLADVAAARIEVLAADWKVE